MITSTDSLSRAILRSRSAETRETTGHQFRFHQREQLLQRSYSNTIEGFLQRGRRRSKKTAQPWRVSGGLSALAHEPAKQQRAGKTKTEGQTSKKEPMQTKQSVTNSNNHQPWTPREEKHAAMKLPIRSTVIAAFRLLMPTLLPACADCTRTGVRPSKFDFVPASDAIAGCERVPERGGEGHRFPKEDVRGVERWIWMRRACRRIFFRAHHSRNNDLR